MATDNFNFQRDGVTGPFVTQHPSWPEGVAFTAQPPQAMQFAPHIPLPPDDHNSRPASSVDIAWPGYRPGSQGHLFHVQGQHNPFCHQHGKPESEPTLPGHACGCPQAQHSNNATASVPPTVPTPPPSDGSPHPGWVPMLPAVDGDAHHVSKRMKYDWNFDNNNPVLRPDGVRKKNAKFEIPDDRNLDTLDVLIKHAKSETELKELKMQKRLLRNREAALHSRQKKKTHTEWLERERDQLSSRLSHLYHERTDLHIRVDDHERDKATWQERLTQLEQKVAGLQTEKQVLVEQHARDNKRLTLEVQRLREQLQRQNAGASPSSTHATSGAFNSDESSVQFNHGSSFEHTEWEGGYDFMNDGCLDPGKLRQAADSGGGDILVH